LIQNIWGCEEDRRLSFTKQRVRQPALKAPGGIALPIVVISCSYRRDRRITVDQESALESALIYLTISDARDQNAGTARTTGIW
jgi:hypothetical protein